MNNVTTFDNFPPFATNGSRNMNTESAKYAVGFLEGETFPAEWANYLFHGATKGISDLNTAVQSIWKENINVIQGSGQTPSPSDNTQLKTAIKLMIQNAVLTNNTQLKTDIELMIQNAVLTNNTQLKTDIELMIQNAVLTANAQVLAQAKLDAHPVGSLYWSSNPTNPSTLFGGTWVQIKDRFIWAKGDSDTVNATGGSKTVTLSVNNLPSHSHSMNHNHTGSVSGSVEKTNTAHTHSFSFSHSHNFHAFQVSDVSDISNHYTAKYLVGNKASNYGFSLQNFPNYSYGSARMAALSERFAIVRDVYVQHLEIADTSISGTTGKMSANESHSHSWSGSVTIDTITDNTGSAGSGTAHENMPPYTVKYCWERTA